MTNICVIPARGGSRRIPKKNIKFFHGKPIIAYSIETAKASGLFAEIYVSTDDLEIANIAVRLAMNTEKVTLASAMTRLHLLNQLHDQ